MSFTSRGFTLIELILVVVLVAIMAVVALPMMMAGFTALEQQRDTAQVEREALLALERMARELRMATDVSVGEGVEFVRPEGGALVTLVLEDNTLRLDGAVLAQAVTSFTPQGPIAVEGACYLRLGFTTRPALQWQQVVYLRNVTSCEQ